MDGGDCTSSGVFGRTFSAGYFNSAYQRRRLGGCVRRVSYSTIVLLEEMKTVKNSMQLCGTKTVLAGVRMVLAAGVIMASSSVVPAQTADAGFGPANPFYAPSALPFHAPPFDTIKDSDYQP